MTLGSEIFFAIINSIIDAMLVKPYENGMTVIEAISNVLNVSNVFQCESIVEEWFGININGVITSVFLVAYWLLVLKFVWKNFDIYMLGGTGDEDADPVVLLINFAKALAISLGFGVLFNSFMNIAFDISTRITDRLIPNIDFPTTLGDIVEMYLSSNALVLFALVYIIMVIYLTIQFMKHTLELVVLRVGIGFASAGLLDSDQGIFKPYVKKFFQITWTILLQAIFFKLSVMALANTNILPGIMAISMAIATPQFLSEFIMAQPSSGKLQQAIYSISILRSFAR